MDEKNELSLECMAMVSVRDLRVSYGAVEIVNGINFEVKPGETLVILGGSGSGKSTLLRTLVGLERASSGEIWIKGKNIAAISQTELDEIRKKIGMSFQGGALFGSMTVGDNVALPLREHTKLEESTIDIILRLKLEQVGLAGFEYYMPSQLSGGMKKRAAVARALAMDPEILFFDEPSAGLDPIIAAGIDQLILELKKAFRMTIVVVTHELASAYLIADRMVLIDKGNVLSIGTTEEMRSSSQPRVRQFLDRVAEPEVSQDPGQIDVTFSVKSDLPVKTDSKVKIMSMSPLGDNHLELLPGTALAGNAPTGSLLGSDNYVDFNTLTEQVNQIAPQAQQLLRSLDDRATELKVTIDRVNDLLSPQNRSNLAATLADTRTLIKDTRPQLHSTFEHVNTLAEKVDPLLQDFRKTSAEANQVLTHIDELVGENRGDVRQAVLQLRGTLKELTGLTARLAQTLDVHSEHAAALLTNLLHVTENLKEFTAAIKSRPYTLIRATNPREHKPGEPR